MKNITTTFALSLLTTLALGATNTAQAGDFYPGDSITLRGDQFGTPRFFSAEDNGDLVFSRTMKGDETVFEIYREGGGTGPLKYGDRIGFQNTNGTFITAMHAGENHNAVARAPHLNDWEYFTIVDMNGNTPHITINEFTPFALKGAHGLVVSGHQSGSATAGTPHIDAWETIYMELDTPSCDGISDAYGMTIDCANEMWEAAGCATSHDHNSWIDWAQSSGLSIEQLRNDFKAWATLTSDTHVNGCQSDFQQPFLSSEIEMETQTCENTSNQDSTLGFDNSQSYLKHNGGSQYTVESLTSCTSAEFQTQAPTPTSDRVCQPIQECANGKVEVQAPTATQDRDCACPVDTYFNGSECESLTVCDASEVETRAPTQTSDRVCVPSTESCECNEQTGELTGGCVDSDVPAHVYVNFWGHNRVSARKACQVIGTFHQISQYSTRSPEVFECEKLMFTTNQWRESGECNMWAMKSVLDHKNIIRTNHYLPHQTSWVSVDETYIVAGQIRSK